MDNAVRLQKRVCGGESLFALFAWSDYKRMLLSVYVLTTTLPPLV